MDAAMSENFTGIVGTLIVTNIGAVGFAIVLLIKMSFFLGGASERFKRLEKDMDAAHGMIRELKQNKEE